MKKVSCVYDLIDKMLESTETFSKLSKLDIDYLKSMGIIRIEYIFEYAIYKVTIKRNMFEEALEALYEVFDDKFVSETILKIDEV